MSDNTNTVEGHYQKGGILDSILDALREMGKDLSHLTPADLAPVDEFHIRGREATIELATRAGIQPGDRVLDVGCGLGGSARYLASEHGARVDGIDLTQEYVDTAQRLAELVGMQDQVHFLRADALDLPFADKSFDVVWTEHAQMNIADKRGFYGELARVLVPGGRLAFHDVFQGPGGPPHFPVPWAGAPEISHLAPPGDVLNLLEEMRLRVLEWEDKSQQSVDWLAAPEKVPPRPTPLGLHLLMGETRKEKIANLTRNLQENRVAVVQCVAVKR
jgi:ubiquinone/menaquinone biosynthesis C-methylase UbiE